MEWADPAEVVRRGYEAFRSHGLRGWARMCHPEIEFDMTSTGVAALGLYSQRGRPAVGGPPETLRYAQIVEVADGRMVRIRTYADVDRARRASELQRDAAIACSEGL